MTPASSAAELVARLEEYLQRIAKTRNEIEATRTAMNECALELRQRFPDVATLLGVPAALLVGEDVVTMSRKEFGKRCGVSDKSVAYALHNGLLSREAVDANGRIIVKVAEAELLALPDHVPNVLARKVKQRARPGVTAAADPKVPVVGELPPGSYEIPSRPDAVQVGPGPELPGEDAPAAPDEPGVEEVPVAVPELAPADEPGPVEPPVEPPAEETAGPVKTAAAHVNGSVRREGSAAGSKVLLALDVLTAESIDVSELGGGEFMLNGNVVNAEKILERARKVATRRPSSPAARAFNQAESSRATA